MNTKIETILLIITAAVLCGCQSSKPLATPTVSAIAKTEVFAVADGPEPVAARPRLSKFAAGQAVTIVAVIAADSFYSSKSGELELMKPWPGGERGTYASAYKQSVQFEAGKVITKRFTDLPANNYTIHLNVEVTNTGSRILSKWEFEMDWK